MPTSVWWKNFFISSTGISFVHKSMRAASWDLWIPQGKQHIAFAGSFFDHRHLPRSRRLFRAPGFHQGPHLCLIWVFISFGHYLLWFIIGIVKNFIGGQCQRALAASPCYYVRRIGAAPSANLYSGPSSGRRFAVKFHVEI